MAFCVQTQARLQYIASLSLCFIWMHCIKATWAVKQPHCLLKFNPFQKEVFMKDIVTKCLVMGALAIGMTSTAMAEEHSKTERLCDLSTLKGLYHYSNSQHLPVAGEFTFDGEGEGTIGGTVKFPAIDERSDLVASGRPFIYEQDSRGECMFTIKLQGANPNLPPSELTIYAEVSGNAASVVQNGPILKTIAYEITRGPISHNND